MTLAYSLRKKVAGYSYANDSLLKTSELLNDDQKEFIAAFYVIIIIMKSPMQKLPQGSQNYT